MRFLRRAHRMVMPVMVAPKACIIFLDAAFDIDDIAMLALAARLHFNGEIRILAFIVNAANDYAAPCVKAVLNWLGLPNIPVGAYQGMAGASLSTSAYTQIVAAEFGQAGLTRANFPDSDTVVRAVLAANDNVALVSTGFLTDMAGLINTASGLALIKAKVRCAYIMGGDYPVCLSPVEFNIVGNIQASKDWFGKFGGPTMLMGRTPGGLTQCGPSAGASGATNPIKRAFDLFGGGNLRSAWDPATVLFFARGEACGYKVGMFGGNYGIFDDGSTVFGGNYGKNCGILVVAGNQTDRDAISAVMNGLVQSF